MQATLVNPIPRATLSAITKHVPHHPNTHRTTTTFFSIRSSLSSVDESSTSSTPTQKKLNKYSSRITEPKSQGGSQAMLLGVGLSEEELSKPQVGISSVWYEGNPCNMHLLRLSEAVKEGVREAGMVGFRFNTIGVSDAISMGTQGMSYSLQSRDLIADSIETVMSAQWYDANISIPGCDKNMPGTIMAMGRLNRPSIMVYGGTIKPGHFQGHTYDIVSAFQCYGEFVSGSISDEQRKNVIRNACPGAGACGGMYTANTMASAIEVMGMSLPYSSSTPAEDPLKLDECRLAGKYLLELLKMDSKPRDIITPKSLRNAMVIVMALGGSTNAVLHLIAIARSFGMNLTLDHFQKVSDEVPFLADLKPSGKYVMEDVQKIGGTPGVIRYLLELGFLDGDCMTVTGKTLAENAASFPPLATGQDIIRPVENPIKKTGHIQTLYGNIAPDGSVAKITGKEGLYFSGEESMVAAISEDPLSFKLLDTGFFHADPHPGNLIRTPDGKLAILDFGLVTKLTDDQKYGMIEAIAHLIHRDYGSIVKDFVKLGFIPEGVNLDPILPVLAKVFDQALEGGGAKNINFQELASDLAQITFDYPFRIPPYFALIIRAIGVLEGIALVGNSDFAIVDEAYPYIAQRLLTDESPRLRNALRYTIYGKSGVFDAERFIDVMQAFENFITAAKSGGGESPNGDMAELGILQSQTGYIIPGLSSTVSQPQQPIQTRAALAFLLSDKGNFFREFLLDEIVKGIDAVTRDQLVQILSVLGIRNAVPVFSLVPAFGPFKPAALVPTINDEDKVILNNVQKVVEFLTTGSAISRTSNQDVNIEQVIQELLPVLPGISTKVLPEVLSRLSSRVLARIVRDTFL